MTPSSTNPPGRKPFHGQFVLKNLKRCPLCRAVNSRVNAECFVCGWSGAFESRPESLEEGLRQMLMQCPELFELSTTEPTTMKVRKRVAGLLGRLFHKRLDINA